MKFVEFNSKKGNEYLFDNNSGQIFNKNNQDGIALVQEYTNKMGGEVLQKIESVQTKDVEKFLYDQGNGFHQLILEVTSQCNFRCKYCCYSDHYEYTHGYTNEIMNKETAKAAIDLFFKNFNNAQKSNPLQDPFIGFYGGEPLLNRELVRYAVNYIEENYTAFHPKYNMTTNGYLLTEEDMDFLVKHDFAILVSLDGHKENHDRNRVFVDGEPTFNVVFENFQKFRRRYPDYSKISVSFCYDIRTDLIKVKEFFETNDINFFRASPIESTNTDYYQQFTKEEFQIFNERYNILKEEFYKCIEEKTLTQDMFVYNFFCVGLLEMNYHCMIGDKKNTLIPYTGTCIPGQKIYVRPDGSIHICERVNPKFSIGDVFHGLNSQMISELINRYNKIICRRCEECSTSKLCTHCFAKFFNDQDVVFNEGFCNATRQNHCESLSRLVDCMELDSQMFDEITVHYYNRLMDKALGGC